MCAMTVLRVCRLMVVAALLASVTMAITVLAPPGYACACGAVVAPGGQHATMNHEVALVHWDGTTETILMQLALNASTDNVALVVATPSPATVVVGDKATFVELDSLSAPQVKQRRHWKLGLFFAASAPREGAVAARPPDVVNQVHLGPLEATTLAGGDLAGLQKWLADNGYAIRTAVSDALGPYVRGGWSFVAMRLTSTAPIVGGLSPVRMTFQSSQLRYPMRLSVAAPSPQQVTVFTCPIIGSNAPTPMPLGRPGSPARCSSSAVYLLPLVTNCYMSWLETMAGTCTVRWFTSIATSPSRSS